MPPDSSPPYAVRNRHERRDALARARLAHRDRLTAPSARSRRPRIIFCSITKCGTSNDAWPTAPPAPPTTPTFSDVPTTHPFYKEIEWAVSESITGGCAAGPAYCPSDPVRRDQMAVFLLKAEHGSAYVPRACSPGTLLQGRLKGHFHGVFCSFTARLKSSSRINRPCKRRTNTLRFWPIREAWIKRSNAR